MSAPSTPNWSDVINSFINGLQSILYQVGQFIVNNAATIATVIIGVGLVYFIIRYISRIGVVRRFLGSVL